MSRLAWLFALVLVGCAGAGSGPAKPEPSDIISVGEIEASDARNALEIVERLRPRWLDGMSRGRVGLAVPVGGTPPPNTLECSWRMYVDQDGWQPA